jgi:hypothetical protein
MIEALRVLVACRKTAVTARKIALQMIQITIVAAPDVLRSTARHDPNAACADAGCLAARKCAWIAAESANTLSSVSKMRVCPGAAGGFLMVAGR